MPYMFRQHPGAPALPSGKESSMTLTHRLEIRLDDERMTLLRDVARRTNQTLGALVREAIDLHVSTVALAK